jgi:hypothetical protein
MKRRRPEPWYMGMIRRNAFFGKVIPPRSIVRLTADWGTDKGRVFRIGYYNPKDGLNCVWLVNESGKYEQTADQKSMDEDFEVLRLSTETDLHGMNREVLRPISEADLLKMETV